MSLDTLGQYLSTYHGGLCSVTEKLLRHIVCCLNFKASFLMYENSDDECNKIKSVNANFLMWINIILECISVLQLNFYIGNYSFSEIIPF